MWKATSSSVSTKLRSTCARRPLNTPRRKLATENPGGAKPEVKAPPPPPPPPTPEVPQPKKGGVFWKLVGLTTVGVGGAVGYAWYDPSFRKLVEDNVPYSKDAFATLFQYIPDDLSTVKLPQLSPEPKPIVEEPKPIKPIKPREDVKTIMEKKQTLTIGIKRVFFNAEIAKAEKQRQKEEAEKRLREKQADEAAENAALEVILENLVQDCVDKSHSAFSIQDKLIETTKKHTDLLKKAMDDTSEILDKDSQWEAVSEAFQDRQYTAEQAQNKLVDLRENLEKLRSVIDEGKSNPITKRNKAILTAQEQFNKTSKEMGKITSQVAKSESQAKVMLKYKDLIQKGRKQFQQELESIMPEVKLGDKRGKKLTEDELNSLIAHAHRRIEQLQKQLAEQAVLEQNRLQEAMENQRQEDEKLTDERVAQVTQDLMNEIDVVKQRWDADSRVQFESDLRHHLSRQAAAHSDHLKEVLKVQEKELEEQFERELHTKILEERQVFQTEVAGWIARLKGIESAVEGRAELEKLARRAQDLWLSCLALNGAIRLGTDTAYTWEGQVKPLKGEVADIQDAAVGHPFVETVVKTLPQESLERGVWTEDNLKARFPKVKRVCKRVAMIDETGGSLFKYFMSYVQSFFIFDAVFAKSENAEIDIDRLDTFKILSHADYWLERGDLEQAVRFMNMLTGEPRRVAHDWLKEAILLLETRQAAYALTAFASASGISSVF
ncbi:hypothetical protein ScPMuIL_001055 [Solemya velum]